MERLNEFWAGIWEGNTKTPQQKWVNTFVKETRAKSFHQWIGVSKKVVNIIIKLMEGWKTRLDVTQR